jgi:hypothetical protein
MGFTALLTAGEKGDPIGRLPGDCAIALPGNTFETAPGVTIGTGPTEFARSSFAGISTWRLMGFEGVSEVGVDDGHGGAGGLSGGSEVRGETSEVGASAISSTLASVNFGVVTSASSMSTSTVGGGVVSLAGVGSRGVISTVGPFEVSMAEGSSSGGEGGSGEGLFEDTSLRVGDRRSIFTDVDRMRSR